ncbi:hypothetical protein V8N76_004537 [Salmonella enterica]
MRKPEPITVRIALGGPCPECGEREHEVDTMTNYASEPVEGSPVRCPKCGLEGETGADDRYPFVHWYARD